jgi:hypothetical protein
LHTRGQSRLKEEGMKWNPDSCGSKSWIRLGKNTDRQTDRQKKQTNRQTSRQMDCIKLIPKGSLHCPTNMTRTSAQQTVEKAQSGKARGAPSSSRNSGFSSPRGAKYSCANSSASSVLPCRTSSMKRCCWRWNSSSCFSSRICRAARSSACVGRHG